MNRSLTKSATVVVVAAVLCVTITLFAQMPHPGRPPAEVAVGPHAMNPEVPRPRRHPAPDPEVAQMMHEYQQLEHRIHELAREFHGTDDDDRREQLHEEIVEVTEAQFEIKHHMRERELERLREQMEAVAEKVQRRAELRDEIIERRVAQLTGEDAELRWDSDSPPPPPIHADQGLSPRQIQRRMDEFRRMRDESLFQARPIEPTPARAGRPRQPRQVPPEPPKATRDRRTRSAPGDTPPESRPAGNTDTDKFGNSAVKLAEARAMLEIARRRLDMAKVRHDTGGAPPGNLANAEQAVMLAQLTLEAAKRDLRARRKLLEIEIEKAELELTQVREELEAREKLRERGLIPHSEFRNAEIAVRRAELNLKSLHTTMELLLESDD